MTKKLANYDSLFKAVKTRIRKAQVKAVLSANAELICMYWDIGRMIDERQQKEGWGAQVVPRLSMDLGNELLEVKGFSERNLKRMISFFREYPGLGSKVPQAVAQLTAQIPWGHNILLIEKVKDKSVRLWYMQQTVEQGWSRNALNLMIDSDAYKRKGSAITNFEARLPAPQSDLAQQALKDPYIFDFLTLDQPFRERELEMKLIEHLEKFLLELGKGFAFVGRQYHLDIGKEDFYIDLLFYHLQLRCFIVIDLKRGAFKPDYAGKMNFYCNVVDDLLKNETDHPTIGLILCQDKNKVLAEYTLRDINKPIGISEYELTRALPKKLRSALPTIDEIEEELGMHRED